MSHDTAKRPHPTEERLFTAYRREIGKMAVANSAKIKRELERSKQHVEYLEFVIKHDQLTKVLNRRGVLEIAREKISSKEPVPFGLMAFDLDSFKKVNDTLGHDFGDEVLVTVGTRLRQIFSRDSDRIYYHDRNKERSELGISESPLGRMGGDEFLGFIDAREEHFKLDTPEARQQWLVSTTQRVRSELDPVFQSLPEEVQALDVGASIGLSLWVPGEISGTWEEQFSVLAQQADQAAIANKRERKAVR